MPVNYFAYGSNMASARLLKRTPSAIACGVYLLRQYRLKFHKAGNDGSAKCDAFYTGNEQDSLYGVLYRLNEDDKGVLDKIEGLGQGYDERQVDITSVGNHPAQQKKASLYIATQLDATLQPFSWYVQHILNGAIEHKLPCHYFNQLLTITTMNDPNQQRQQDELAIYN